MLFISAINYQLWFEILTFVFCMFIFMQYSSSPNNDKLLEQHSAAPAMLLALVLILFIGLRPVSWVFGDTVNYAVGYARTSSHMSDIKWETEWLFSLYSSWCKSMGFSVNTYFLGIEMVYIGFQALACRRLVWESPWVAFMFILSAFSFFTYGVNGLRNGAACAMVMYAIVLVATDGSKLVAGLIVFLAMGIHRSVMLPAACCAASIFVVRSPKLAIYLWVASIGISLVGGSAISGLFSGLGLDDRTDKYLSGQYFEENNFSRTGFRWDFLLYSAVPVLLTWQAVVKREIEDKTLNILATTYILANAFWVMMNRVAFSNRFAYLSWFLYPLLLAYIMIRPHIWDDQDRKCAWALLLHATFTLIMFYLGKA